MVRLFVLLSVLVISGCGGASLAPSSTPTQTLDLDPETAQLWAGWATEAQQIAVVTGVAYQSRAVSPSRAAELQAQARTLAKEIRLTLPSNELVLRVASDLDRLVGAIEFALEYSRNSGVSVSSNVLNQLFDALNQLIEDAIALGETLETP